jgi:CysZ protein
MKQIFAGMHYFISGFSLITKPGIKRYVFMPLLINALVFISLFLVFRHYVSLFNNWFALYLPVWLQWLSAILWLLFIISFILFFITTFVIFANIISAPFNSLLSEAVENYLCGKTFPPRSLFENIKDIPRIIGRQFAVLIYYALRMLLVLILFLIPLTQPIATIVWFLFSAWFVTLTYLDYPSDNHRVSFFATKNQLHDYRLTGFGFGITVLVVTMIPGLNLLVIPAAVAGATEFWLRVFPKK